MSRPFEPVYFAKPGDTAERVASRLLARLPHAEKSAALDAQTQTLLQLNPRLRAGPVRGRQILSLTIPEHLKSVQRAEKPEGLPTLDSAYSRGLVQYQEAREKGVLRMDPALRRYYEDNSAATDAKSRAFFDFTAFLSSLQPANLSSGDVMGIALNGVNDFGTHTGAPAILRSVKEYQKFLDSSAAEAKLGKLNGGQFKIQNGNHVNELGNLMGENFKGMFKDFKMSVAKQRSGISRLNDRMIHPSGYLPRAGRQFSDSSRAFSGFNKIRVINGMASLAFRIDLGVRVSKVLLADDRNREALAQSGGFVSSFVAGPLVAYGVCNLVLTVPSGGASIVFCGVIVGGVSGYFASGVAESLIKYTYDEAMRIP